MDRLPKCDRPMSEAPRDGTIVWIHRDKNKLGRLRYPYHLGRWTGRGWKIGQTTYPPDDPQLLGWGAYL